MSQIKQMIRLHQQGYAIKAIARSLSISKNTVKSYLYKIGEAKLNMTDLWLWRIQCWKVCCIQVIRPIVTPDLRISKSVCPIWRKNLKELA
jgi:DNA-binding NarL/FixJ family response regulator